jgi:hypothetical protein
MLQNCRVRFPTHLYGCMKKKAYIRFKFKGASENTPYGYYL